jgi:hypothetical protein
VQRRLRALHRILQPARTDICAPPSHSGPKTRAAAFPGTLLPGTASQVRPTDKRTGEVQAYAAFPWASDEVLCWERRREMLRAELVSCEADVICLQVGATSIPKMTPLHRCMRSVGVVADICDVPTSGNFCSRPCVTPASESGSPDPPFLVLLPTGPGRPKRVRNANQLVERGQAVPRLRPVSRTRAFRRVPVLSTHFVWRQSARPPSPVGRHRVFVEGRALGSGTVWSPSCRFIMPDTLSKHDDKRPVDAQILRSSPRFCLGLCRPRQSTSPAPAMQPDQRSL